MRTSLEPFGEFDYVDAEAENAVRHVEVVPLYALSNLRHTPEDYRNMIGRETMEAGGIRADNRQKEMDLSKMYVD